MKSAPASPCLDTSSIYDELVSSYEQCGAPLHVSFRDIVQWIPYRSTCFRYTHQIHSYPAKLIPQIPNFFLNCQIISAANGTTLDPFGGTGTVALESILLGKDAVSCDSNPLARLITRAKTTPQSPRKLQSQREALYRRVCKVKRATPPDVVNVEYWFTARAIRELSRLSKVVQELPESPFQTLCQVALSSTVRKVSLTDPRISVPVRLNPGRYSKDPAKHAKSLEQLERITSTDAIATFFLILEHYSELVCSLWAIRGELGSLQRQYSNSLSIATDSLAQHAPNSISFGITSPPYLGAQKYIRFSSLSLGWLSIAGPANLRHYEDLSIGREHYPTQAYSKNSVTNIAAADELLAKVQLENPLRAHIASQYLMEMAIALGNSYRAIKPQGYFVLVSGCNMICGRAFDTTSYLRQICQNLGFSVQLELSDTIKSRGLMTKRNKTAGIIPLESVIVFQK